MIYIFDSGIGGLSIADKIHEKYGVELSYVSDYEGFPYGEKSEDYVIERCEYIVSRILKKTPDTKAIIIACNTASTVALYHLRKKFAVPFIGVVPAIKPAVKLTKTKAVVLLATKATNSRSYTDQLIKDFASGTQVIKVSAPELVLEAEKKPEDRNQEIIQNYCDFINNHPLDPDVIILGCTHYTFLKAEISKLCPKLKLIDSVDAIVQRLENIVHVSDLNKGEILLHTTKEIPQKPNFMAL